MGGDKMTYTKARCKALKGFMRQQYFRQRPLTLRRIRKLTYMVFITAYAEGYTERGL